MTTTQQHRRTRRPWQRLEPPQVTLLALVLVVADVVVLIVMNIVVKGVGCTGRACEIAHDSSVPLALVALGLAVLAVVVPVGVAFRLRRGLRTVGVVQVIAGILLIVHAAGFVSSAQAFRRAPAPAPTQLKYIPCVEQTMKGYICVSQPPQSPAS